MSKSTLDSWLHLLRPPVTIPFEKLHLTPGRALEPIVEGSGEMRLTSLSGYEYTLTATVPNTAALMKHVLYQQQHPYDGLARFRLYGTDASGMEWALGWTIPSFSQTGAEWVFTGSTDGIAPYSAIKDASLTSSTEVIYLVPRGAALANILQRSGGIQANGTYLYTAQVLGNDLEFVYDPGLEILRATVAHSAHFPPTYTENWIGEPFRILLGELVYPRLVARNLGGGDTHLFIRRANEWVPGRSWGSLLQMADPVGPTPQEFWRTYVQLLALIASVRDKRGHPNFESHEITKVYEEIIQSAYGTHWVWALTLASAIEGMVKMLGVVGKAHTDRKSDVAEDLIDHIEQWDGDPNLKKIAIDAVARTLKVTAVDALRNLVKAGVLTQAQYSSWEKLRNAVTHGKLLSPYSDEETDRQILLMLDAMRALTIEVLTRSLNATVAAPASPSLNSE